MTELEVGTVTPAAEHAGPDRDLPEAHPWPGFTTNWRAWEDDAARNAALNLRRQLAGGDNPRRGSETAAEETASG